MFKFFILLILSSSLPAFALTQEEQTKVQIKAYFDTFKTYGIKSFGYTHPVSIESLNTRVDQTTFYFLDNATFEKQSEKSRRSAFYKDGNTSVIFINKDKLPSAELLAHEIIRDKQYEISNGMAAIHNIHQNTSMDLTQKRILVQAIKSSIDYSVDRFGISAESPHKWISKNVQDLAQANHILSTEGGDVSGGGGDDLSVTVKSRVLAELSRRLLLAYQKELGMPSHLVEKKISNLFFLLSVKVYFETDYSATVTDANQPEFNFGADNIENLGFFPYLIRIHEKASVETVVPRIVDVILQSDLFKDIPSIYYKYYSECECRGTNFTRPLGHVCPDPKKFHPSVHWLINWYQQDYEKNESCKMILFSEGK